jgi:hypothetical protein
MRQTKLLGERAAMWAAERSLGDGRRDYLVHGENHLVKFVGSFPLLSARDEPALNLNLNF